MFFGPFLYLSGRNLISGFDLGLSGNPSRVGIPTIQDIGHLFELVIRTKIDDESGERHCFAVFESLFGSNKIFFIFYLGKLVFWLAGVACALLLDNDQLSFRLESKCG
jgi:hypothetical protein